MKPALLTIEKGATELIVPGIKATDYDVTYDFRSKKLQYEPVPGSVKPISTYLISKELAEAVNAAIVTGRPLLIKGEPGSGKTKLAQAVASWFFGKEAYKYYFEWHVKSKSKAAEGGYVFDHVGRLRDATISSNDPAAAKRAGDPVNYISLGAMGMAFISQPGNHKKPILLIDEIDKGDIDFPNDLLLELDEMRFRIHELPGEYIEAPKDQRPLVFITSNSERDLPPAFLRRCLYYNIPPFDHTLLYKISSSKLQEFYSELDVVTSDSLSEQNTNDFVKNFLDAKARSQSRPPSTSEMLDWLKLLTYRIHHEGNTFEDVIENPDLRNLALKLNA